MIINPVKLFDLLNITTEFFKQKNIASPRLDAEILFSYISGIPRTKLLYDNFTVENKLLDKFKKIVELRAARIPVAYITGEKEFYSNNFFVDEHCLIPRPETEQVVDLVLEKFDKTGKYKILDLCCGSGNILISVLKEMCNSKGVFVDVSEQTLYKCFQNIEYHSLLNRSDIIKMDILNNSKFLSYFNKGFDIIVCNPPYVNEQEYCDLQPEIKKEPKSALVPKTDINDDLIFYKTVINYAEKILNNKGKIFFEISESNSGSLQNYIELLGIKYQIHYGLNSKPNVLEIG
jgi:release factor glutamine methyltransferase